MQGITPREIADLISDVIKDKVVCDIGCGDGTFMKEMAKYAKEVVGIEENEEWAKEASRGDFVVYHMNSFFHRFPEADVYYSWNKGAIGDYLKAKWEGVKGTFIFGYSVRPFFREFIQTIPTEFRKFNNPAFGGVWITKL